jgi:hypothetical protein
MAIERVVANGAVIGACGIALKVLSGKLAHDAGFDCRRQSRFPIHSVVLRIRNRVVARGPFKPASSRSRLLHMQAHQRGQPAPSMSSSGNAVLERRAGQH